MLKKFSISATIILIALLVWEFWLRYTFHAVPFEPPLYVAPYLTERDATLRWRFSPSGGRNSLGLRNREIAPKPTGTYRILFLGDSLVWTGDTSSGELYTQVLETRLNARYADASHKFEVINAGVPGYTTYQELEFLKIYGIEMEPDLVVLGFVFNDLYYPYLHRPNDPSLIGFEPESRLGRFDPDTFPGIVLAHSYLGNETALGAQIFWRQNILHRQMFPFEVKGDFYLAWKSHPWKREQVLIGEMRERLAQKKIPLYIVVFPVSDQVNDAYLAVDRRYVLYPQSRIQEIANGYALPLLDLTDPIYKNGGVGLFQDYLHLNASGNDLVASEAEKFLVRQLQLIPR